MACPKPAQFLDLLNRRRVFFSNFLVCLVMFLHLVSTDVEGLHFEPIYAVVIGSMAKCIAQKVPICHDKLRLMGVGKLCTFQLV